jgi:hypothetical protein
VIAYATFEFPTPATSSVEVEATEAGGLTVNLECRNTVEDLAALEDALRKTVVRIAEQRALIIELAGGDCEAPP